MTSFVTTLPSHAQAFRLRTRLRTGPAGPAAALWQLCGTCSNCSNCPAVVTTVATAPQLCPVAGPHSVILLQPTTPLPCRPRPAARAGCQGRLSDQLPQPAVSY